MRLAFATETDEGRQLSNPHAKDLTGDEIVHARRMKEDFWSFTPTHTLVMVTNHKPQGTRHRSRNLATANIDSLQVHFWNREGRNRTTRIGGR